MSQPQRPEDFFRDAVGLNTRVESLERALGNLRPPLVTSIQAGQGGIPQPVPDGFEVYYIADDVARVLWHLRYNAGSASSYKWEWIGGSDLFANETATHNPLTSTTPIDKNGGPLLAIPLDGDYEIIHTGELYTTPNNYCYVGMTTAANTLIGQYLYTGNFSGFGIAGTMRNHALGLTAQTIKARVMVGGGSGYVQGVRVWARPVRVG